MSSLASMLGLNASGLQQPPSYGAHYMIFHFTGRTPYSPPAPGKSTTSSITTCRLARIWPSTVLSQCRGAKSLNVNSIKSNVSRTAMRTLWSTTLSSLRPLFSRMSPVWRRLRSIV